MSTKRIIVCTPYLDLNGAETSLLILLSNIKLLREFEIHLIAGFKGRITNRIPEGVKVHYLHEISRKSYWKAWSKLKGRDMREAILEKIHNKVNPDFWVINATVMPRFFNVASKVDVPIMLYIHELKQRLERLDSQYIKDLAEYSSLNLASSQSCKRDLLSYGFKNIKVLPPPIDFSNLTYAPSIEKKKKDWHWIAVGNLDSNKNPELFVEIASIVIRKYPETTFTWVGGDLRTNDYKKISSLLETLKLKSRVRFVGWQEEQYHDILNSADGFICTSGFESFGISVLEAAYRGVPVISTRCIGPQETLGDLLFYAKGNAKAMSDLVERVMQLDLQARGPELHEAAKKYSFQATQQMFFDHLNTFES